jgi:ubiquitin C-terminal hydrolase
MIKSLIFFLLGLMIFSCHDVPPKKSTSKLFENGDPVKNDLPTKNDLPIKTDPPVKNKDPVKNDPPVKNQPPVHDDVFKKPLPLPNLGSTCFNNAAFQAFLACVRKDIVGKTYASDSLLGLLKEVLLSKDDVNKVKAFVEKSQNILGCPRGQQYDSAAFLENFLKHIASIDPDLAADFQGSKLSISFHCNPPDNRRDRHRKIEGFFKSLDAEGRNVQEILQKSLNVSVQDLRDPTKFCQKISKMAWPKYLIALLSESQGRQQVNASLQVTIDKLHVEDGKTLTYDLIAAVIHHGTETFGHYFAYVKYGDQWYKANDATITPVDSSVITSTGSFKYFVYQLRS